MMHRPPRTARLARALFALALALTIPAATPGQAFPRTRPFASPNAFSLGIGLDKGILGVKYARALNPYLGVQLGAGLNGFAPQVQVNLLHYGGWNLHATGGVIYSPWEFLLLGGKTLMALGGTALQLWPYYTREKGLYLDAGVEAYYRVTGITEGNQIAGFVPRFGLGWAF